MTEESRLAVMEREMRGMHETIKVLVDEVKALTRSVIQSDQQHLQHQRIADLNRTELEDFGKRIAVLERDSDQQKGAISIIRWFLGTLATVALACVGWLLSVVLSTQSAIQIQQSKQSTVEARLQILEQRRDRP
jgi:hypothetical protein